MGSVNDGNDSTRINRKQARYFDKVVHVFDREQPPHIRRRLERIVSHAGIQSGETVLDVGAGVGVLIPYIQAAGAGRCIACELSKGMLDRLKENHPEVETFLCNICELEFPDASMDVIFMNAVFPNITDKRAALENCSRILKIGGRLVISHPEGRDFVLGLRDLVPFPLDPLPSRSRLTDLVKPLPLKIIRFIDQKTLYVALLERLPS
jgi:ubiquinone/menaquinone biosynthesis C-methylase UbiE